MVRTILLFVPSAREIMVGWQALDILVFRPLLILRVEGDGMIPARVAKELHRSRPWTSFWLVRYRDKGVDGLKDKPRSGRPSKLSEQVQFEIKRELS